MDPMTIGFFLVVAILVVVLMLFMFRYFGKETDFEKAYGQNALRLLAEDKSFKPKTSKASRKTKTTAEKKKDVTAEKEQVKQEKKVEEPVIEEPVVVEEVKPVESNIDMEGKRGKKKGKKQHIAEETIKPKETKEPEKPNVEPKVEEVFEKKEAASITTEEMPLEAPVTKAPEKKAKKKKSRKNEDLEAQALHPEIEEKKVEMEAPIEKVEVVKTEKPKQSKPAPVPRDITEESFLSRLSDMDGFEPEYLSFAVKHFTDSNAQKKKLTDELGMLKKQSADREKLVAQCTEKIALYSKRDEDIEKLRRQIQDERKKYEDEKSSRAVFEQTAHGQINTMQQEVTKKAAEINALKQELMKAKAAVQAAPSPDVVKQAEVFKNEVNSLKSLVQQRESELKQKNQMIEKLKHDAQESQRNVDLLTQSNTMAGNRTKEIEAQAEAGQRVLEEKLQRTEQAAGDVQRAMEEKFAVMDREVAEEKSRRLELEKQIRVLQDSIKMAEKEREKILRDNHEYCSKVVSLEEDHKEALEKMKVEMEELEKENEENKKLISVKLGSANDTILLLSKENEKLESEAASLKGEIMNVKEREKQLKNQLQAETQKSQEAIKAMEAAKSAEIKVLQEEVVILKNAAASVPEPEIKLITVDELQGAKPVDDGKLKELEEKLAKQEKKNEELRASNYQVVEVAQKQEQTWLKKLKDLETKHEKGVSNSVKETARILSQMLPKGQKLPPLPSSSEGDVLGWLKQVDGIAQKYSAAPVDAVKKQEPAKPAAKSHVVDEGKVKQLEEEVDRYRTALADVAGNLELIEREAANKRKSYEKEIAQLRSQLVTNAARIDAS